LEERGGGWEEFGELLDYMVEYRVLTITILEFAVVMERVSCDGKLEHTPCGAAKDHRVAPPGNTGMIQWHHCESKSRSDRHHAVIVLCLSPKPSTSILDLC
jgi:hypothetical protein